MKRRLQIAIFHRALSILLMLPAANLIAADSFPDVSKLPSHPDVPDPLEMFEGRRVTTSDQWFQQRRPELKALFEHYMYGSMPTAPEHEKFTVDHVDSHFLDGKATEKEVTISFDPSTNAPRIHLLLVIPNGRPQERPLPLRRTNGPAGANRILRAPKHVRQSRGFPVFLGVNFCGNQALSTDTNIALSSSWMSKACPGCVDGRATEASRGTQVDVWALEQSIDRGYAVASFYCGDIQPDLTNAPTGLLAWLKKSASGDSAIASASDCGVIEAWAWGVSRAVDYLVTDRAINPRRIAVTGHSRLGKAAALAAAFDERIALAVPLQAGCGGTSPSRGKAGESVKAINDRFPHWFNAQFKKFNDQPDRLPFDQNCLLALIAPRAILIGCATEDKWSNPTGQFQMLQAADPVYHLLGVDGLETKEMPEVWELVGKRTGYFIRPGKHSMTKGDWKVFLDFADRAMP